MTANIEDGAARWHAAWGVEGFRPQPEESAAALRKRYADYTAELAGRRHALPRLAAVDDALVPGGHGRAVRIRIYERAEGSRSVLIYIHGGGWTIGNVDSHDHICREFANRCGLRVIALEYGLAPEHPFPAALDDCTAVVRWAAADGLSRPGGLGKLLVGGDSAGANLAACAAVRERDAQGGVRVDFQILLYGALDVARSGDWWFRDNYLPHEADRRSALANPLTASPRGLPDAIVVTAGYDALRPDSVAMAGRLRCAGVRVELQEYEAMPHGFLDFVGIVPMASAAMGDIADEVNEWLSCSEK